MATESLTSIQAQCFLQWPSVAACSGRIRAKRFPRCARICSAGSQLSLGAQEGPDQRGLGAFCTHPCTESGTRVFRSKRSEHQHVPTESKQWGQRSNPQRLGSRNQRGKKRSTRVSAVPSGDDGSRPTEPRSAIGAPGDVCKHTDS